MNRRSAAREFGEVISQLIVVVVMEALDGRLLDCAVPLPGSGLPANRERDALDLAIGPGVARQAIARNRREGVFDLGKPMVDFMLSTDTVKDALEGINVPIMIGELDAIVHQHDVEPVGHGGDQVAQKGCGGHFPGLLVEFHESELGGAVPSRAFSMPCQATDCDEEIQPIVGKTVPRTVF